MGAVTGRQAVHDRHDAIESPTVPTHFPGLEALRALAASMVVVHHVAFVAGGGNGHLASLASVMDGGVAVFFVLSGFLIFRPFAAALSTGSAMQAAPAFWWRRILRVVPAYWLALSVLWALGNFRLGDDWWKYYLLLQPFDRYTAMGGIVPAWSLSTEMCFYLIVPVFALVIRRITTVTVRAEMGGGHGSDRQRAESDRRSMVTALLVVGLGSIGPLSRATAPRWAGDEAGLAFQWLPTNLDLFAAGMLLAVASVWSTARPGRRAAADSVAGRAWPWWVAAGGIFVAYAELVGGVELEVGYQGWFWQRRQFTFVLFAVLLMVPMVFGDQSRGTLRRIWAWRPLAWVGTVSYGLYLWHLGVLERLVDSPPGREPGWDGLLPHRFGSADPIALLVATFAAGLVVAAASWYLLERPLQRFKGVVGSVAGRG